LEIEKLKEASVLLKKRSHEELEALNMTLMTKEEMLDTVKSEYATMQQESQKALKSLQKEIMRLGKQVTQEKEHVLVLEEGQALRIKEAKQKEEEISELKITYQNSLKKAKKNILYLKQMLESKEETILEIKEAQNHMEGFSLRLEVIRLSEKGMSKKKISKKLDMPLNKVELILKFNQIKKEQYHTLK